MWAARPLATSAINWFVDDRETFLVGFSSLSLRCVKKIMTTTKTRRIRVARTPMVAIVPRFSPLSPNVTQPAEPHKFTWFNQESRQRNRIVRGPLWMCRVHRRQLHRGYPIVLPYPRAILCGLSYSYTSTFLPKGPIKKEKKINFAAICDTLSSFLTGMSI